MKKQFWAGLIVMVCSASVGMLAQTAGQTASSSQRSSSQSAANQITVTGCVQQARQAPTGTTGSTTPSSSNETKFVLTNAAMGSGGSSSTPGAAGTAGSPPSSTAVASEYRLDADDAKLTAHVGHKVEITGTVEPARSATQPPAASAANAPKLKVDNVKMIATTCP